MGDGDVMLIFLNNNPRHPQPPPLLLSPIDLGRIFLSVCNSIGEGGKHMTGELQLLPRKYYLGHERRERRTTRIARCSNGSLLQIVNAILTPGLSQPRFIYIARS